MTGGCGCGCGKAAEACGHDNRPGLPALSLRLGTHGTLLSRMRRRLHTQEVDVEGQAVRPLRGLTAR